MKKNIIAIVLLSVSMLVLALPTYIFVEVTLYKAFDPRSTHIFVPLYVFIIISLALISLMVLCIVFTIKNIAKIVNKHKMSTQIGEGNK